MKNNNFADQKLLSIGLISNSIGLLMVALNSIFTDPEKGHSPLQITILILAVIAIAMGVFFIVKARMKGTAGK